MSSIALGAVAVVLLVVLVLLASGGIFEPKDAAPEPPLATPPKTNAPATSVATAPKIERTVQPTVGVALAETPTQVGPAPTASGLITPTVADTAGDVATSTPIPTRAATPIPPTRTSVPTTRAPAAATPTTLVDESPPPTPSNVTVGLLSPNNGDARSGNTTFSWEITGGVLPANQAFEVILWQAGQDPNRDGVGLASLTRGNSVTTDLAALDADPNYPLEPGAYFWGVRLVQLPSGLAIGLASEPRQLRYDRLPPPTDPPPTEVPP